MIIVRYIGQQALRQTIMPSVTGKGICAPNAMLQGSDAMTKLRYALAPTDDLITGEKGLFADGNGTRGKANAPLGNIGLEREWLASKSGFVGGLGRKANEYAHSNISNTSNSTLNINFIMVSDTPRNASFDASAYLASESNDDEGTGCWSHGGRTRKH